MYFKSITKNIKRYFKKIYIYFFYYFIFILGFKIHQKNYILMAILKF